MGIFLAGFSACSNEKPQQIQCSVLIDITGSNAHSLQNFKSEDVLTVLDLKHNSQNAIEYRQAFITETFLNFTHQFTLSPAKSMLTGNEFDREEKIKEFTKKLETALSQVQRETGGRKYSSVYVPFAREVNRMAQTTGNNKRIILLSDLVENSEFLSFFAKNSQEDLEKSPEMIAEYFQKELALADDLTGMTIHLVHQPNERDNWVFKKLSRVYRAMLEKRGARVLIQANLML